MTAAEVSPPRLNERKPPRWVLPSALVPIFGVLVAGWVAAASWAALLENHPLLLIALSPINRFLMLTTNDLSAWSYYSVGLGRHLLPDPFFYLLGFWYGAKALTWGTETYPGARRLVGEDGTGLEHPKTRKILYPLAFFIPNNWVSLLCGSARIPIRTFVALNVTGTLARLVMCRVLGTILEDQIRDLADFIGRYQRYITLVSVVFVVIAMFVQLRPGGQIQKLTKLDED